MGGSRLSADCMRRGWYWCELWQGCGRAVVSRVSYVSFWTVISDARSGMAIMSIRLALVPLL